MALVTKVNPIGIDIPIDTIQRALYKALITNGNWQNYQSYHRAYKNPKGDGIIPEIFSINNDYKESFFDDKYDVVSMFIADDVRPIHNDTDFKSDVSIIFHVDLTKIIDTVTTHRADEEFINVVASALRNIGFGMELIGIETELSNVYTEFDLDTIKWDNMQPYFAVRFNMAVPYYYDCSITYGSVQAGDCNLAVSVAVCPTTTIGGSEGTAEAFTCGAVGSLTYLWDDPLAQTTKKATGLSEGTYSVTVTDTGVLGCSSGSSGTVIGPGAAPTCNLLITGISSTRPSVFGASDGTGTVTTSGAAGTLSYIWDNGETTNTAVGLDAGPHSVSVLDAAAADCHASDAVIVDIGMAFSLYTKESGSTTFVVTGDGTAIWTDEVETIVGDSATFTFADATEKKITVYGDPLLITELNPNYYHSGKITNTMDISQLTNLTGYIYAYNNDDPNFNIILPTTSSAITRLKIDNCAELTELDFSPVSSNSLNALNASFNPKLITFTGGVSSGPITSSSFQYNTLLTSLDLSGYTGMSGTIRLEYSGYTTVLLPSTSGAFTLIYGNNCTSLTSIDLSPLGNISTDIRFNGCSSLTSVTFPDSTGSILNLRMNNCNLSYADVSVLSGGLSVNSAIWNFSSNNLTTAEVNQMLVEMYGLVSSEGGGGDYTGRSIQVQGNSAPDGSSGGYDGDQAVIDLVAKGITVTTD
jgi:hypothetical protein|tara:strand:+ start:4197 stop:6290 length:2094 start_codon:yes stop_codon:yes gene_type:complete